MRSIVSRCRGWATTALTGSVTRSSVITPPRHTMRTSALSRVSGKRVLRNSTVAEYSDIDRHGIGGGRRSLRPLPLHADHRSIRMRELRAFPGHGHHGDAFIRN